MEDKNYKWSDENIVAIINRESMETDLVEFDGDEFEFPLVDGDGRMNNEIFEALREDIRLNLFLFIRESYSKVASHYAREARNKNAQETNPHYRVYWRNPNAYQNEYKMVRTYKTIEDARDYVLKQFKDEYTSHKIIKVVDGVEEKENLYQPMETLF